MLIVLASLYEIAAFFFLNTRPMYRETRTNELQPNIC